MGEKEKKCKAIHVKLYSNVRDAESTLYKHRQTPIFYFLELQTHILYGW